MAKKKVFWTKQETRDVAEYLLSAFIDPDDPHLCREVREGQKVVLPPDRWKTMSSNESAEGVRDVLRQLLKERRYAKLEAVVGGDVETATEQQIGGDVPIFVEPNIGEVLGAHVARAVLRAVEEEVNVIVEAMKREIKAQLESELHTPVKAQPKVRKPKLLVVGLLPAQAGMVSSEFYDAFDLRFVETNANLQQLRDSARGVDRVLLFTGKVSHSNQEAIRSVGAPIEYVSGGMTSLRDKLTTLFVNWKEAA